MTASLGPATDMTQDVPPPGLKPPKCKQATTEVVGSSHKQILGFLQFAMGICQLGRVEKPVKRSRATSGNNPATEAQLFSRLPLAAEPSGGGGITCIVARQLRLAQ